MVEAATVAKATAAAAAAVTTAAAAATVVAAAATAAATMVAATAASVLAVAFCFDFQRERGVPLSTLSLRARLCGTEAYPL